MTESHNHRSGVIRREFLQVGFSAYLGLSMTGILAGRAEGRRRRRRVSRATGSRRETAGQVDDPGLSDRRAQPPRLTGHEARRSRGDPGRVPSDRDRVPGIQVCEHLPELAARADKLAIVRSLSHGFTNHLNATHELLTGHSQPGAFFDKIASRDDYPCYAAGLDYVRPRSDGVPSGVMLPTFLMEGPLVWPGQHAGFLGPRHDPWQIRQDPNRPGFQVDSLSLPVGFSVERLGRRQELLDQLSATHDALARHRSARRATR